MGVNPTPTNFKTFTFGGENSRSYGVYITGEGVFNAPERNVEMIDIPGRNGAFALDRGNFNNIEVTYPAGIFADTEADFAQAVSDLRNLLCSKVGYVRLEDDYNPNEYRMAIYKSGLDVDHDLLVAGEFDLTFECKPQRYLKSGESAISVTSGDTITNPTRFDAQPLLEVEGYGKIGFNGFEINVENADFGIVNIVKSVSYPDINTVRVELNDTLYNVGDPITVDIFNSPWGFYFTYTGGNYIVPILADLVDQLDTGAVTEANWRQSNGRYEGMARAEFVAGTNYSGFTQATYKPQGADVGTFDVTITIDYTEYENTIDISIAKTPQVTDPKYGCELYHSDMVTPSASADSSLTYLGHPTYIDCEIGEAYQISGGQIVPLNKYIDLGSELPTLASGENEITFDNTVTDLKLVPRWWKV